MDYAQKHDFLVSDYVLLELQEVLPRHKPMTKSDDILHFLHYVGVKLVASGNLEDRFLEYIEDEDDAQILYDAYVHSAILLVTQNTKDYHIEDIMNVLGIRVLPIGELLILLKN